MNKKSPRLIWRLTSARAQQPFRYTLLTCSNLTITLVEERGDLDALEVGELDIVGEEVDLSADAGGR